MEAVNFLDEFNVVSSRKIMEPDQGEDHIIDEYLCTRSWLGIYYCLWVIIAFHFFQKNSPFECHWEKNVSRKKEILSKREVDI